MTDFVLEEYLRRIRDMANRAMPEPRNLPARDARWTRLLSEYSLRRALALRSREKLDGVELEVHEEMVSRGQLSAQANAFIAPYEVFAARALTVAGSGGFSVETANLDAADALRPRMVAGALGATLLPAPYGANVTLPRQSATATAYWLGIETAQATESDQTFGQVAFTPKTAGAYTEVSRQLLMQASPSPADFIVKRDLANIIARGIDLAALYGTGLAGQPLGIASTPGIGTFSAASCDLTKLVDATAALGNGLNESAGAATTLTIAGALRKRAEVTGGSRTLWEGSLLNGFLTGLPARSSGALTVGDIIIGSWAYLNIIMWGGVEISVNPFAQFQQRAVGIRCFATVDTGLTFPSAFTFGSSFS